MAAYRDDASIKDDAILWRRIHPNQVILDCKRDVWRPYSGAFQDSSDGSGMSVQLADVMQQLGLGPQDAIRDYRGYALAAITAGSVRELGQGVARTPQEGDPAHATVFGPKTKKVQRKLAVASEWVLPPPEWVKQEWILKNG